MKFLSCTTESWAEFWALSKSVFFWTCFCKYRCATWRYNIYRDDNRSWRNLWWKREKLLIRGWSEISGSTEFYHPCRNLNSYSADALKSRCWTWNTIWILTSVLQQWSQVSQFFILTSWHFFRAYPFLKPHLLFHSNGHTLAIVQFHDIRHIKVNIVWCLVILNLIELNFFRATAHFLL